MADNMKLQNMNEKEIAKWLHDTYEDIAKKQNWNTQDKCKVTFDKLPLSNQKTMISVAREIRKRI